MNSYKYIIIYENTGNFRAIIFRVVVGRMRSKLSMIVEHLSGHALKLIASQ